MTRKLLFISIIFTAFVLPACFSRQTAEYLEGATIRNGLRGDFFNLTPKAGQNEVLIFRHKKTWIIPPVNSLTYLFIEVRPDLIRVDKNLNIPSENVLGYVCSEVHPDIWCGPISGEFEILEVTQDKIECHISIEAKPEQKYPRERGYEWSFYGNISFKKSSKKI